MDNFFPIAIIIGSLFGIMGFMALTSPVIEDWARNLYLKQVSAEFKADQQAEAANNIS